MIIDDANVTGSRTNRRENSIKQNRVGRKIHFSGSVGNDGIFLARRKCGNKKRRNNAYSEGFFQFFKFNNNNVILGIILRSVEGYLFRFTEENYRNFTGVVKIKQDAVF